MQPHDVPPPPPSAVAPAPPQAPLRAEVTLDLLDRARAGDDGALNQLLERCLPPLRRWAHGRLPERRRGVMDTSDLVQDTIVAAMRQLGTFVPRHQGALQAYLRMALMNRVRDIARYEQRRPERADLPDRLTAADTSPLDRVIGLENSARYEAALARLRDSDREAVIARLELQYDYDEIATLLNKPSANAARVAVTRAVRRLVDELKHDG